MNKIIAGQTGLLVLCSLIVASICSPVCHDNIPFSIKLAQSTFIAYGEIVEILTPLSINNSSKSFNLTFLVKCTLKGIPPIDQTITIEHSPPDNPICYRTLVNGYAYVFFLNQINTNNYYKQMSFHELSFNDDTTIEILKRTCGIQTQPFHKIIKQNEQEVDKQCPTVSIGCI